MCAYDTEHALTVSMPEMAVALGGDIRSTGWCSTRWTRAAIATRTTSASSRARRRDYRKRAKVEYDFAQYEPYDDGKLLMTFGEGMSSWRWNWCAGWGRARR